MRTTSIGSKLLVLIVLTTACSSSSEGETRKGPPVFEEVRSSLQRDTSMSLDATAMKTLRDGNTAFALRLHEALAQRKGNVVSSPYSVSTALAMTYAGARGETEREMGAALEFRLGQDKTHVGINEVSRGLHAHASEGKSIDGAPLRLSVDNTVFAQKDTAFESSYLDLLAQHYGAGVKLADFKARPDEERVRINDWVTWGTEGRVRDLLPEKSINDLTRLVLVNTIHMNAAWEQPFDPNKTTDGPFFTEEGGQVTAKMMSANLRTLVASTDDATAITLRYSGGKLVLTAILPKTGTLSEFERALDTRGLDAILDARKDETVIVTMPRFRIEGETTSLADPLKAMGMRLAFEKGQADFSGMAPSLDLMIREVFHKAFLDVGEQGTEAAAATGVVVGEPSSAVTDPLTHVVLDRPFMVLIRDEASGAILFTARVAKP